MIGAPRRRRAWRAPPSLQSPVPQGAAYPLTTSSTQVTPNRSFTIPYSGAHGAGSSGRMIVAPSRSLSPVRRHFRGVLTANRNEERDLARIPSRRRRHVVDHDAEAALGGHLAPHDLLRLRRILDTLGVGVGDQDLIPAENGSIEGERRACVAAKIQVGHGFDRHRILLTAGCLPCAAGGIPSPY